MRTIKSFLSACPLWLFALVVGGCCWGVAIFLSAPSLHDFTPARIAFMRTGDYLRLCANPLERATLRDPMLAYRILPPTLTWLLGLGQWGAITLLYLASIGALVTVCFALSRRLGRRIGALAALLVALSYAITWPNCMLGYGDPFAHLAAASLLLVRRPWKVGLLVLGGLLCDERFFFVWPMAAVWHWDDQSSNSGLSWLRSGWPFILGALLAWLLVRHALAVGWIGAGVPHAVLFDVMLIGLLKFQPWDSTWPIWILNVLCSFRWSWVVIGAGIIIRWRRGGKLAAGLLALSVAAATLSTYIVADVSRSVGFSFLAIPIALAWLAESSPATAFRYGRSAAWLCVLTPNLLVLGGYYVIWFRPLPLRILAYLTGQDPLSWL